MKKIVFIVALLLWGVNYSQVVLKGFNLGGYSVENESVTTVGGLPGVISLDKMNNGKIWMITFSSTKSYRSNDNEFEKKEFYSDLKELISGIEEYYLISFDHYDLSLEKTIEIRDLDMTTTKNGVEFKIVTGFERRNYKEWISFRLRSPRLDQINRNENPNKHDY